MTSEQLAAIAARNAARTQGKWEASGGDILVDDRRQVCCGRGEK